MQTNRKSLTRLMLVMMTLLLLPCTAFAAPSEVTKEYTFKQSDKDFAYDAPESVYVDGKEYQRSSKEIKYKVLKEVRPINRLVEYKGLSQMGVPLEKAFRIDGKLVTLHANLQGILYEKTTHTFKQVYSGYSSNAMIAEKRTVQVGGMQHQASLTKVTTKHERKPITVQVKFTGVRGATYQFNGREITLKEGGPTWNGFEQDVKQTLRLPGSVRLTSGTWSGRSQSVNGQQVRYATFSGTRPSLRHTAIYSYPIYATSVRYSNHVTTPSYKVKAMVTYEQVVQKEAAREEESNLIRNLLIGGAALILIAGLVVLSLYVIGRRRKQKGEEAA